MPRIDRRSLLTAAGVAGAGVLARAAPARANAVLPMRVMSYNIHHGEGTDGRLDLERIAQVIEERQIDLIGLQEVDRHWSERSAWVDQAGWLAERLRMHHVYGANLDREPPEPGKPRRQYGTAVLSRWPVEWWRNTSLPKFGDHEQRGLLEVEVQTRAGRVRFANTHLQHNDAEERKAQAERIVELLDGASTRTFLVGDINAVPGSPPVEVLTSVLTDSWPVVGAGGGYTYPAEAPRKRIDYVLASGDAEPRKARVLTSNASDHLPYVVKYFL